MKNQFREIERIIINFLSEESHFSDIFDEVTFTNFERIFSKELSRISQHINEDILQIEKEDQVCRYVIIHQKVILQIINNCTNALTIFNENKNRIYFNKAVKHIYSSLDFFLQTLEEDYDKYFNKDEITHQKDRESSLEFISENLISSRKNNPGSDLIFEIVRSINRLKRDNQLFTFRNRFYLRLVTKSIYTLSLRYTGNCFEMKLQNLMLHYNFNTPYVFRYFTTQFSISPSNLRSYEEVNTQLLWHLKRINQFQQNSALSLIPELPGIKEQLTSWILEEINFHENKLALDSGKQINFDDFKIEFNLSVHQLAALLRLFLELKIITNKVKADLFRFVAQHSSTKNTKVISSGSLKTKFHNINDSTMKSIKDLALNLFNKAQTFR